MADNIIRGTTPTIKYTFDAVDPSDITVACLTVEQGGEVTIERGLAAALVGEDSLSWVLTQEDTLGLLRSTAQLMCNWKLRDGTRGASRQMTVVVLDNQKDEVI